MSFAWQAQGIVHLVKSEQKVKILWQFQLQPPIHYTRLHDNRLHDTPLHYAQLHYTTTTSATRTRTATSRRKFYKSNLRQYGQIENQRGEESERRRREVRRSGKRKSEKKKMQVHEKVGKSQFTAFFKWFEGRKVGSLKRQSQLAIWEMKNCTLLWR